MISLNLPPFPLVPVSSSQAVVGAVVGIGLVKGSHSIKAASLGKIALGWVATPVISGMVSLVCLFIVSNIFPGEAFLP